MNKPTTLTITVGDVRNSSKNYLDIENCPLSTAAKRTFSTREVVSDSKSVFVSQRVSKKILWGILSPLRLEKSTQIFINPNYGRGDCKEDIEICRNKSLPDTQVLRTFNLTYHPTA